MTRAKDIKAAETFGIIHFASGGDCIPCQSSNLNDMIKGMKVGQSVDILRAFIRGWTKANLA